MCGRGQVLHRSVSVNLYTQEAQWRGKQGERKKCRRWFDIELPDEGLVSRMRRIQAVSSPLAGCLTLNRYASKAAHRDNSPQH